MKQHITVGQLQELTEKQLSKLDEWSNNKPVRSIGQMVEYLDEHRDMNDFVPLAIDKGEFEWHVYSVSDKPSFRSVELCDALWSAVKETLNK